MANKKRAVKKAPQKPTRKPRKPAKRPAVAPKPLRQRRIRRSSKTTQVTGREIDDTFDDILDKTPLERRIHEKAEEDEEDHPNLIVSTNYQEVSPFDPDVDIDEEPENRNKMYEVPAKPRSPDRPTAPMTPLNEPLEDAVDDRQLAAHLAYKTYFD